jgi:hypothetical protein
VSSAAGAARCSGDQGVLPAASSRPVS